MYIFKVVDRKPRHIKRVSGWAARASAAKTRASSRSACAVSRTSRVRFRCPRLFLLFVFARKNARLDARSFERNASRASPASSAAADASDESSRLRFFVRAARRSRAAHTASHAARAARRGNVDAALAIEVCADDCGEALFYLFLVASVPKADETRQLTEDDELRTLSVDSRRLQKVPETLNVKLRSGARIGGVSTSPRAETEESLD